MSFEQLVENLSKFETILFKENFLPEYMNQQDKDGNTLLHIAAEKRLDWIIEYILSQGAADKTIRNHAGETAFDIAKRRGLEDSLGFLDASKVGLERYVIENYIDRFKSTPVVTTSENNPLIPINASHNHSPSITYAYAATVASGAARIATTTASAAIETVASTALQTFVIGDVFVRDYLLQGRLGHSFLLQGVQQEMNRITAGKHK